MNCIRTTGGCQSEKYCKYAGACLFTIIKAKTPKSRWKRLMDRAFKFQAIGHCDFSNGCKSCQQKECSFKKYLESIVNFKPKQPIYEYRHPIYGIITSLIDPNGKGLESRKKKRVLMKYGCCQTCGSKEKLTVDHIKEISKNGSIRGMYNMTILCITCNQLKSDSRFQKYKKTT